MVSIDGTDISGATIDGTDVSEITVDGDVVWTAFPDSNTAQYQFDARTINSTDGNSISNWTDSRVSGVTISGSGTYRDSAINGKPAVQFDGSSDGFISNQTKINRSYGIISIARDDSLSSGEKNFVSPADDNNDRGKIGTLNGNWFGFGGDDTLNGSSDTSVSVISLYCGSGGNSYLREDGVQTSNNTTDEGFEAISLGYDGSGNRRHWSGYLGFVEIQQGITYSEFQTREQEVANYWGYSI